MLHADETASLAAALDADPSPVPGAGDRLAAVLAPIVLEPRPALILTVRAAALSRHAGEVSFPGGLQDPGETLAQTALREAHEEIGLDPSAPRLLGALPAVHTFVSGILVVPFVASIDRTPTFTVNEGEIDEVLMFGLERLARAERRVSFRRPGGRVWRGFAYELDGHTVWGATGWMLHTLLETIRKETTWPMP
ncbi:MAG TPA: CoA pyrophosphatase [Actinomycetota bacterium]|jgi:8-oxo-dGTP pyrophosphatase MutT (NUDIX family)|nr:CoA pyrophosphatase [Actinomycetota bacterium]